MTFYNHSAEMAAEYACARYDDALDEARDLAAQLAVALTKLDEAAIEERGFLIRDDEALTRRWDEEMGWCEEVESSLREAPRIFTKKEAA